MIKLQGKIRRIFDSNVFGNFEKRVMWLDEVSETYPNTWQLEFWNKDCVIPDSYKEGDFVTCYIDIKGKLFSKKDGEEGVGNTLKCWNIEKDGVSFKKLTH